MPDDFESPAAADHRPVEEPLTKQPLGSQSRLRRIASVLLVLLILACPVGIVAARWMAGTIGFDYANVATFLLTMLALFALIPTILLRSQVPLFKRLLAVSVVVLLICAPFLTLRLDGYDGRLVPIVHWVWAPKPAPLTSVPQASGDTGTIDLTTHSPEDVPQFLGPHRRPDFPNVQLEHDWQKHPPEELWRHLVGAGWSGFSVVNGFAVTMEQRGPEEVVACYSILTGDLVWAHSQTARHETVFGGLGPRSTPTIDDGLVYALGATGLLCCLEGSNGELIWSDDLLKRCGVTEKEELTAVSWGRAASPLVVGDLLIVPLGGPRSGPQHSLVAYDKKTGEIRWLGGDEQIGYSSPSFETLCGIEQVVIVNESSVSGHDLEDGHVLWRHPWEGQSWGEANCSQAVVLPGDQVLLTNRRKCALLQLVATPGKLLQADSIWVGRNRLKTKFTNVVVRDGYVYGLSDGILECIELATGKRRWKTRRGDYGHGQILGVGDVLLIQAETGEIVMVEFNPQRLVELGRVNALSERTWNTPCLFGKLLLVRNASEVVCYRLK